MTMIIDIKIYLAAVMHKSCLKEFDMTANYALKMQNLDPFADDLNCTFCYGRPRKTMVCKLHNEKPWHAQLS